MAVNRKIALIDLDIRRIKTIPVPDEWRQKFLGGRGLGAYLACKYTLPGGGSLESGNTMVISAGLLAGTLSSLSAITYITAKSPLTGILGCALLPGLFAAEMRWAGFDHLVLSGCARSTVSLLIHNGSIQIKDASDLKGYGVSRTCDLVRKEQGDEDLKILAIGPAGENLVRFATIADDAGHTTGRTGMGAVLGSKKIKALACRGTLDVEIKFPEEAIVDRCAWIAGKPADPQKQTPRVNTKPIEVTLRHLSGRKANREPLPEIKRRIEDYGLDPQAVLFMADWAAGCFAGGIILDKAAKGDMPTGDCTGDIGALAEQIAFRKGPGDTLAGGPLRASAETGSHSFQYSVPVKDLINLYREATPDSVGARVPPFSASKRSTADYRGKPGTVAHRELSDHLLDCLGDRACAGICPTTGRLDLERLIELIRLNTGLELTPKALQAIAYRCYAIERLYNLREEKSGRQDGSHKLNLDVPGEIKMDATAWNRIDLRAFKRFVAQYYRLNGWDRKTVIKKKVLEQLGVGDLWGTIK